MQKKKKKCSHKKHFNSDFLKEQKQLKTHFAPDAEDVPHSAARAEQQHNIYCAAMFVLCEACCTGHTKPCFSS